jgi:hypothetical protein
MREVQACGKGELNIWIASLGFPPPEIWGSQETRKRFPIGERRRRGKPSLADEPARNAIPPWGLLFNSIKLCLPGAYPRLVDHRKYFVETIILR